MGQHGCGKETDSAQLPLGPWVTVRWWASPSGRLPCKEGLLNEGHVVSAEETLGIFHNSSSSLEGYSWGRWYEGVFG